MMPNGFIGGGLTSIVAENATADEKHGFAAHSHTHSEHSEYESSQRYVVFSLYVSFQISFFPFLTFI